MYQIVDPVHILIQYHTFIVSLQSTSCTKHCLCTTHLRRTWADEQC
uniref:Uncharacterized protein n=1 Tax=Arundo donax TaxID=35708 RepID=A0A0A8YQC3_ARUDO